MERPAGADMSFAYWSRDADELVARLGSRPDGLTSAEAAARLAAVGPNRLGRSRGRTPFAVLVAQLRNPLLLLLLFAATVSAITGEWIDATIVTIIVVASVALGFSREHRAESAAAALRARIRTRANVLRDGRPISIAIDGVVPGDVFLLAAGSLVPADAVILEATDCYVSEAALTGESFPVEKRPGALPAGTPLARRANCVFLGTNVQSGDARCLAVETGARTRYGAIARRLTLRPPLTEFDRGVRRFGELLTIAMLVMVFVVFVAHMLEARPVVETLLFAIALAVGLSPELLPAILTVNLARGATLMAAGGVLVRRLNAIENLGSMDILCTDKTGTLTEGVVQLDGAFDAAGAPSAEVLDLAALNAALGTGLPNPLDDAILAARPAAASSAAGVRKLAEIPFDFIRKRVSVVVVDGDRARLVTKGAFHHVLDACTLTLDQRAALEAQYQAFSERGIRVLAVATRALDPAGPFDRACERSLTFRGFLTFLDREKADVAQAIADLARLGVAVKIITGDARPVAQHVASRVGLHPERILDGAQLDALHDEALWHAAERTVLFVEVDPNQKERIISALRKTGHVVGFLGDGVNDAPAMHAADTSLSVEGAVDVARDAADFVLLERDLDVIRRGIEEGRRTFANTLKYVLMTTSANLGNMISMAIASLFLPFLPLTAGQILLNNFVSDIPALGLADDAVDPELVARPRRWDLRFIARFMIEFGLLSSAFDLMTFAVLIWGLRADPSLFRTTWFVESLLTELVVVMVVRTRRPFYRSRPGPLLFASTVVLAAVALAIPYLPLVGVLGFVPLPPAAVGAVAAITLLYVTAAELLKRWFYRERASTEASSARLVTPSLSNSIAS
jgi:Mg2+-importing ATPase